MQKKSFSRKSSSSQGKSRPNSSKSRSKSSSNSKKSSGSFWSKSSDSKPFSKRSSSSSTDKKYSSTDKKYSSTDKKYSNTDKKYSKKVSDSELTHERKPAAKFNRMDEKRKIQFKENIKQRENADLLEQSPRKRILTPRNDEVDASIAENYIFGRNPVFEVMTSNPDKIEKIYIPYTLLGDRVSALLAKAKKDGISITKLDKNKFSDLERRIGADSSQGIIALIRPFDIMSYHEVFEAGFADSTAPLFIALDDISDPHNLGAIARTAECAGAAGILISDRNSSPITPTAVKASAGALAKIPVAKVTSFPVMIKKFKDMGGWIVGLSHDAKMKYTDFDFTVPVLIFIGSEGFGLKKSTETSCDELLNIPMHGDINSLNASVSAAIVIYEALRQRSL